MSLPRLIYKRGDRLIQEPVPEIAGLRRGQKWRAKDLTLYAEDPLPLEQVQGSAIEIQATFDRSAAFSTPCNLLLVLKSPLLVLNMACRSSRLRLPHSLVDY